MYWRYAASSKSVLLTRFAMAVLRRLIALALEDLKEEQKDSMDRVEIVKKNEENRRELRAIYREC